MEKNHPLLHKMLIDIHANFSNDQVYEMIMRLDPTFKKIEEEPKNFEKFKDNYIIFYIKKYEITKDFFQENGHYYKAFGEYEHNYLENDLKAYINGYVQALEIFNLFNKHFNLPIKEKVIKEKVIGSSDGKIKMKRHKKKVPKSLRRKSLRRKSLRRKSLRRKSLRRKSLRC